MVVYKTSLFFGWSEVASYKTSLFFKIWKHFRSALSNLRILSLSDGLSDPISQFPRMPTMETSEILNSVTANYRQLKRRRLLPPKSPKVSNRNSYSNITKVSNKVMPISLNSFNVTQLIAGIITSLVTIFMYFMLITEYNIRFYTYT